MSLVFVISDNISNDFPVMSAVSLSKNEVKLP